jgi:hypothetical protein
MVHGIHNGSQVTSGTVIGQIGTDVKKQFDIIWIYKTSSSLKFMSIYSKTRVRISPIPQL